MKENDKTTVHHFSYNGRDSLLLPAVGESFADLKAWIIDVLGQLHATPRDSKQFIIAADEIFSNIVSYAYVPEDDPKTIEVSLFFDESQIRLSMVFADRGMAFNPLEESAKLPTDRIHDRVPGGIGLFLVHQFMDELNYRREESRNVLTISKVLHRESAGNEGTC